MWSTDDLGSTLGQEWKFFNPKSNIPRHWDPGAIQALDFLGGYIEDGKGLLGKLNDQSRG